MIKDELYASHIPVLTRLVDQTEGPILELGMGFSTMIVDMMCRPTKRLIESFENDRKWYDANHKYASNFHKIMFTDNWDEINIDRLHWSVALVDHRPAKRRKVEVERLKNNADYIIVHDSEPENDRFYRYSEIYSLFKYRYDYTRCFPNTTVLSNFLDPESLFK